MSELEVKQWAATAVMTIGGAFFIFRGFRFLRLARRISGIATSKVRSAAMGLVELKGIAKALSPALDPIYQRPCSFFRIKVQELRGSGKSRHWETVYSKSTDHVAFDIEDPTGRATVFPKDAELFFSGHIDTQRSAWGRFFRSEDAIEKYIQSLNRGFRSLRLIADILFEGDPLYVLGHLKTLPGAMVKCSKDLRELARELKANPAAMKRMDENNDGLVDSQEWERGLEQAKSEADRALWNEKLKASPQQDVRDTMMIQKLADGDFILATSEGFVTRRMAFNGWGLLLLGCALVVGGALIQLN